MHRTTVMLVTTGHRQSLDDDDMLSHALTTQCISDTVHCTLVVNFPLITCHDRYGQQAFAVSGSQLPATT